ncbi:LysR substrate-binding domain-containing protein [Paracoccus aminovorans]|uniref:LysR substrate-binding domain-containing protein n=1 Tax=Paracoccus aminovorans TaxID=34004 RepID=UPI00078581F3|nr:LysR substrate-binding domain-containing protein [Paracoccus aminovorans]
MNRSARPGYTPSIQELRALVLCAETGSASRAAEALNLTQSAVSRAIRTLEERLGVRLFRRVRQRLILSDAGRALVRDSREILDRLERSARMVMSFGDGGEVLRLAALPTFAAMWLIPRLPDFARIHPQVSIDLTAALGPVDFADSPFDAALQRAEFARPGARVTPLVRENLVVVAAPGLVGPADPEPAALMRWPLIQQATRPELWSDWFALAGVDAFDRMRGPRLQHFDMVIAAAQAGLGIALLPDIFAAAALRAGSLRQVSPLVLPGRWPYGLIRPQGQDSAALAAFAAWLERIAENEDARD